MIKFKKILAGIMASTMMFSAVGCGMIEKTEAGKAKTVVAKVYGQKITYGEVESNLTSVYAQMKQYYGENYKDNEKAMSYLKEQKSTILNTLVEDIITKKKGTELGVIPSDEEVLEKAKEQLATLKASLSGEEEYKTALEQAGFTEETFINDILKKSVINDLVTKEVVKDIKVSDEEIKTYYDTNQSSFTEKPNQVQPAHILVATEQEAKDIIARLDKGEDFAALAAEKGTDATKDKGGDLGLIDYSSTEYDKTFLMAAIGLKKGEYTKAPVQTKYGYHVIKCLDKQEYPVLPLEDVKEKISSTLLQQNQYKKWTETMDAWKKDAKIKLYEDRLNQ